MDAMRVLLVEDEALIAMHTQRVLQQGGHVVIGPATRLPAALELARHESLDAAVLDVHLAGLDVWPLAELLRDRKIGFVLLTGSGSEIVLPRWCRDVPVIGKPYRRETLLAAVAIAAQVTARA